MLEAAGIRKTSLFVAAIDDKHQLTELVKYVRLNYPDLHVVARAVDREHVYQLYAAGCRDIIRETFDSSVRAGRSALVALGFSAAEAERIANGFVADDQTSMIVMAGLYDSRIPSASNEPYVAKAKELMAVQEALLEQGPGGFGGLSQRLAEMGEDPAEIVARYRRESEAGDTRIEPALERVHRQNVPGY